MTGLWLLLSVALGAAPVQRGLLVCVDPGDCADDMAFVARAGDGGPGGFQVLDFDGAFAVGAIPDGLDALGAFRVGLEDARAAVADGKWGAAEEAADRGIAALAEWRGPIPPRELFEIHALRGVAAVERGRDAAWQYSFRQAAAVADGFAHTLPPMSDKARRAWLDEQRKLAVTGRGTLELSGGPEGTRWWVDGREAPAGPVSLLPGNHRVTAVAPGKIRSWKADVPVLPGRTSAVSPEFLERDEAAWVLDALLLAVLSLDAPESVKDLLVAYCAEAGVDELRVMRVDQVREHPDPPRVSVSAAPVDRPPAAAGEAANFGDGIPTTYEAEVAERHAALAEEHTTEVRRLRVVFFDPDTRRFSADTVATTALRPAPERVRVGLSGGGMGMTGRALFGLDLGVAAPVGAFEVGGRLGVVRAEEPYNLYPGWVDRQLYRVAAEARWRPPGTVGWVVSPSVGLAADVYVPLAVGGRVSLGARAPLARGWAVEAEGFGGWLDVGPQAGVGIGLSRGF